MAALGIAVFGAALLPSPLPPGLAGDTGAAWAQQSDPVSLSQSEETLFRADEIINHGDIGVTVLRGNVEIAQGDYVLTADTVSYNREADTLTASGDVVMLQPDGTVVFSTYLEVTSDGFKNGVIENIRILLAQDARIAANAARRSDGNRTEMAKAVYSPCDICREDPSSDPLWQLKARRITHNEEEYLLQYEDAWLEFAGLPVLYAPYFQHYDSRVERKSGFLIPSFGSTTGLDRFVQPRYFWAMSEDKDLTVEPIIGSNGDVIAAAKYRQRFNRGYLNTDFSIGELGPVLDVNGDEGIAGEEKLDGRTIRGHIRAEGEYHINETWRAGLNVNRLTDESYGRAYPLFDLPGTQAVSTARLEGFRRRNYANVEMLSIQSLRTDPGPNFREQDVVPRASYSGRGEADSFGGRWQFDADARFLAVENDDDLHRLSLNPGYGFSKTSPLGFKWDGQATVHANGYVIERDVNRAPGEDKAYEFEGTVVPKASSQLSYPFVRYSESTTQTVTPILFGTLAPNVDPPDSITFEDTTRFELDEINVLSHDRLKGNDAIDSGSRLAAALRYDLNWGDYLFNATLARTLASNDNEDLDRRTNIGWYKNDWVGSIGMEHADYGSISYSFRTDDLGFQEARRQTVNWSVGPSYLRTNGNYTFVDNAAFGTTTPDSEFYSLGFSGSAGNWLYSASINHDITADTTRSYAASFGWVNECLYVRGTFSRAYTVVNGRNQTLDGVLVTLSLKTLGEYDIVF
ncbi:LPS-assembly protein LptD [Marivibrio halodurans]|uniref:LPS-assembly protein LptD n=1 Tax=Marivibrio halodurans TaxID=2039722 RepID=A0A8J7S4R3_9PROT|nr:LPS assembly protein LptD [Marivibrio halodurans]MBP5855607.1 LPS-assembly protein LptD [Marivibrio halodurans]